jgi:hypothetical protein
MSLASIFQGQEFLAQAIVQVEQSLRKSLFRFLYVMKDDIFRLRLSHLFPCTSEEKDRLFDQQILECLD